MPLPLDSAENVFCPVQLPSLDLPLLHLVQVKTADEADLAGLGNALVVA